MNATKHDPSPSSTVVSSFTGLTNPEVRPRAPPSILGRAFADRLADELNAAAQVGRQGGDGLIEPSRVHLNMLLGTDEQCTMKDALKNGDFKDDM